MLRHPHWGSHASLANAPRIPKFRLTVFKACGATDILHLCQQGRLQVSVDTRQREDLENTADLATSKAVFTSKLATKAVLYLYGPGCRSTRLFSCTSKCRWNTFVTRACMYSQFTPLSIPTCNLLQSSGSLSSCDKSTRTVGHHVENTVRRSAIERNPRRPFQAWHLAFFRNTRRRTFHASRQQTASGPV